MVALSFSSYHYVPVLESTEVTRIAYNQLQADARAGILPVFELTRHRGGTDFGEAIDLIQSTAQHPFLIDIDKRVAPPPYQAVNPSNPAQDALRVERETQENNAFNAHLNTLLSPANGFENWRAMVAQFPQAAPILQYTNPVAQANAIIRQASLLSQGENSIAMRISQTQTETLCSIAAQIVALLPSSSQILLIFDCGQGRRGASEKAAWVTASLQSVLASVEVDQAANLSAVCMSNSYPSLQHEGIRVVENCDREIWAEATETNALMFGDYAASHRTSSLSAFTPRTYRATVVHSQDTRWITHRHENADDPEGWEVGCVAIRNSGDFDPIDSWTDNQILNISENGLGNMDAPRSWHAARVAGHIERQFRFTQEFDDEL